MRLSSPAATLALAAAAAAVLAGPSRAAAAPREPNAGIAYGVTAGELAVAGVFYLNFGTRLVPNHGPGMIVNAMPVLIGPAAGWGLRHGDASPALAVHGGGWLGLDMFLLGSLIDGRQERGRMKVGPAAITMGALGAIGGAYVSYRHLDTDRKASTALVAAPLGFAAGGIVLGGIYVLAGGLDGDKAPSQFATGAIAGLTIGLGVAAYTAFADEGGGDTARTRRLAGHLAPNVETGPRRFIVSVGGAF